MGRSTARIPKYRLLGEPEEWTNGFMVHRFEFLGVHFRLMQSICKQPEDEEFTMLLVEEDGEHGRKYNRIETPWFEQFGIPTFDGILTVDAAVQVLQFHADAYHRGHKAGYSAAQHDIRKAIGI